MQLNYSLRSSIILLVPGDTPGYHRVQECVDE